MQLRLEHQSTADIKNVLMTPLNTAVLLWRFLTASSMNDAYGGMKLFKEKRRAIITVNGRYSLGKLCFYQVVKATDTGLSFICSTHHNEPNEASNSEYDQPR